MSAPDDLPQRIGELCEDLAAAGYLTRTEWREALHAVPRHLFVPGRAWAEPNGPEPGFLIDRNIDEAAWWDAVYADNAIITQRDDGATDVAEDGVPTSSCSAPATVVEFLEALQPEDRNRVLEIGTGTGWTAALLAHRVGAGNVVSVEVDPDVSGQAAKNLTGTALTPRLIVGDGTFGFEEGAPFDRVHVAVGVAEVPFAWVEQTRPGGVIVAPYMPGYGFGWLARLHVLGDGTAVGRFPGMAGYMMLRGQRPVRGPAGEFVHGDFTESTTRLDPRRVAEDHSADLAISAMVPGIQRRIYYGEGEEADECTVWILERDIREGSWASVDYVPGDAEFVVQQHGERRLWDEVETAYLRWLSWGRPGLDRFGLTVSPGGRRVWLDAPERIVALSAR
ncbi:methyltransferase domain-containing protein [Actinoallomurus spadix]|uniref:Protein-L-isoaspartate O-methyltransferase n=1 Tax=Actinoallomurus spadix TaxID=79912 RepID=A0ABN0WIL3_9ACTN|nr:methyltransferase domain-containing protein [Actinoallomurus spadix]MCO5989869.1 methyltransferase domain-containing protein [Actinoallomurus spadix]